jgi:hypothetical protein
VVLLVVLIAAVAVVVLVMRAAAAAGGPGQAKRPRLSHPSQVKRPRRVVGPDDDPEFLRELQRRARRDDSPA